MKKFIVSLIASAALIGGFASPALASYNHVDTCKGTLRGIASDDDLAAYTRVWGGHFAYWGDYWHASDGSVYVYARIYSGSNQWALGHCWGGDYGPDSF